MSTQSVKVYEHLDVEHGLFFKQSYEQHETIEDMIDAVEALPNDSSTKHQVGQVQCSISITNETLFSDVGDGKDTKLCLITNVYTAYRRDQYAGYMVEFLQGVRKHFADQPVKIETIAYHGEDRELYKRAGMVTEPWDEEDGYEQFAPRLYYYSDIKNTM